MNIPRNKNEISSIISKISEEGMKQTLAAYEHHYEVIKKHIDLYNIDDNYTESEKDIHSFCKILATLEEVKKLSFNQIVLFL